MAKTNKLIESNDGTLKVPYSEITHACMCLSMYALLQYLLLHDEDTIKNHTCYFCGYAVNKNISDKLPSVHFSTRQTIGKIWKPSRWLDKIKMRASHNCKYPFLRHCKIYAQDIGFLSSLIGKRPYALLSDGPNWLSQNMQPNCVEYQRQLKKAHSVQGLFERMLYGRLSVFNMGNNHQCKEIFLTESNTSPVLEGKKIHIDSLASLWQHSPDSKRKYIMDVFDLVPSDLGVIEHKSIMFMTLPLVKDPILTETEYVALRSAIFANYDASQMVLKPHPRDNFNYQQYFPPIALFNKPLNIQLLVLLGVNIKKAVAICSSSVNAFPEEVQIDWYGAQVHPKIHAFYGDSLVPFRSYTQQKLHIDNQ